LRDHQSAPVPLSQVSLAGGPVISGHYLAATLTDQQSVGNGSTFKLVILSNHLLSVGLSVWRHPLRDVSLSPSAGLP
jgi:hypothetical protein